METNRRGRSKVEELSRGTWQGGRGVEKKLGMEY